MTLETLSHIWNAKCPHCRKGKMFCHPTLYLPGFLKMHRNCPVCGQDFMPEPGFYFGAMYFSYAINVALMVFFGVAFEVLFNPTAIWQTLASVFIPTILVAPWNFRISRALMLWAFGGIKAQSKER